MGFKIMNWQSLIKKIQIYLFTTGYLGHVIVIFAVLAVLQAEGLSLRQLLVKAVDTTSVQLPQVIADALKPRIKFADKPLDGTVIKPHPRILMPEMKGWRGDSVSPVIANRVALHSQHNKDYLIYCHSEDLLSSVVCWLTDNDKQRLKKIVRKMLGFELNKPTADTNYSNGWQLALAYDLVFPALTESERIEIEKKIKQALIDSLANLDEEFASLWHGRTTHASIAWLCAIVLTDRTINVDSLRRRAQGHFLTAVEGLAYTQAWPGGYNYWIQSRAFLFVLASSAYINGLNDAQNSSKIKQILRNIGYWTLYATRPDNRIEGFGDEGSRDDLKDETRRVIDLIVQQTRDPVLAGYSRYLARLHGVESYYRGYRWGFLLFNDPSVIAIGDGSLASLGNYLPNFKLFGKESMNLAYFRSGWGKQDTFISFKAGHSFAHHGHYDAGHFSIFKNSPLAINSSTYNGFFTPHRLNYAIRTIAKNSLIIEKPHERVRPNRFFKKNVADGGQRLTMPTGSAVLSVADWFENYKQGKHYEAAELMNYAQREGVYAYISVDITEAYNSIYFDDNNGEGKAQKVVRRFLYLPDEDNVIVYDFVASTRREYVKKWLLHTITQPKINGLTILKGSKGNGILESRQKSALVQNKEGMMRVDVLYPEKAKVRLVGGNDYQYYVETDGDDTEFNGENFIQGSSDQAWFDVGKWRLEVLSDRQLKESIFLIVLSLGADSELLPHNEKLTITGQNIYGLTTANSVVLFAPAYGSQRVQFYLAGEKSQLLVTGLALFKKIKIKQNGRLIGMANAENGVAYFASERPLKGNIELQW